MRTTAMRIRLDWIEVALKVVILAILIPFFFDLAGIVIEWFLDAA